MAVDYSWCAFSKPKDQNKTSKEEKVSTKVKEVTDINVGDISKSSSTKAKKPLKKTQLKAKTKLKSKTPLKKSNKPINKKSANKEEVTKETYNVVFKRDKGQCRMKDLSCKGGLALHHINGRGKGRTNNVDNCIMLCDYHHNGVVHKENKKYRPLLNEMIKNE